MEKRPGKCTVLMTGPAASVKGGIRTVVNQYLASEEWGDIELLYIPSHLEGPVLKKLLYFAWSFFRISFSCITRHVDILHMHVSERGSFWRKAILLLVFRKMGIKTVLHHHGAEFFDFYEKASPSAKEKIARVIELADVNLVLSDYHNSMMQSRFHHGRFAVLRNAITAADAPAYDPDAAGILFVGRMGTRKGIYDLINVLEEMEETLPPEISFFFCGDGEVEKVAGMLREKKLEHRAAHIGWCSKEQLRVIYTKAMLFILPSYHEGLPMALLEAMHAGIPCISTNVDAIPEALASGINGLLIEPGDTEQMKNALWHLIQDKNARLELGKRANRTICESFLLERHIEKLKRLYAEIKDD